MGVVCKGETKELNPVFSASNIRFSDSFSSCSEKDNFFVSSLELPCYSSVKRTAINWP